MANSEDTGSRTIFGLVLGWFWAGIFTRTWLSSCREV